MKQLLEEIRHNKLLCLLAFVPMVFAAAKLEPEAHTLLFVLSVLAILPLAALLSHATESVAAKTGDAIGGLLNATLGNLTELVIVLTTLRAGQYMLVEASIAGAIVTNTLFVLGAAFTQKLSVGLAVLLIAAYGLGMLFSLKTHRELFASAESGETGEAPWPVGLALATPWPASRYWLRSGAKFSSSRCSRRRWLSG